MELAIETAMGSSLQNIVIENDRHAQDAIAYLKRHSKGRATFLPMNLIQASDNRIMQYQAVMQQHSCQPAISMLKFDPEYRPVLHYLLNQAIVAPDLKTATKISAKLDRSFRIVTPEGDLVNPGGSITGGSIDKRRLGLLSRRREIDDLKKEKADAEAFLVKGSAGAKRVRNELAQFSNELETAKKHEQEANIRKASAEQEVQVTEQNISQAKEELEATNAQRAELQIESEHFDTGKDELSRLINLKEGSLHQTEQQLSVLSQEIRRSKQTKDLLNQKLSDLKSKLSAGHQEENGKIALKERLWRQVAEMEEAARDLNRKREQVESERIKINEQISDLEAKLQSERGRLSGQEALIFSAKQEKEQILVAIKELESKERSFRRRSNEFQNQLHQLELALNQKTLELENILNHLNEDYGSEWSLKIDPDWTNPVDALLRIGQLKEDLKELGPVNLTAIDEYQQVKQRFDFLTNQTRDLGSAKQSLLKVIAEIEQTIAQNFSKTFQEVRFQFKKIFGDLFAGGNADLFLLEPENPLNSGIEIVAQPPGKKQQSLSLLSGGERSLIAIALLFAILAVKPAPFCIFDEIDSNLDEVNVSRFAKLLEMFSKRLQLVVVTHRRGTMEAADTIYGVTMEEMGVTKLISLDLRQIGQEAG
jgi:Chromosome segregation ATPases